MAKRKKKSKKESSGSSSVLVVILVVVGGGFLYGYLQNDGDIKDMVPKWEEIVSSDDKDSKESPTEPVPVEESSYDNKEGSAPKTEKSGDLEGRVETAETNPNLPSYTEENKNYFTSSFDFAWPAYTQGEPIVEHEYFTLRYNEKTEQADWVAYKLTAANLANARYKRKDNFRADPMVTTQSAHPDDYKGSGYDRGHLAPAADFTWSESALSESFYMSNMSPQAPGFNRGIWKKLEEQTRDWAKENQELFVVTGPLVESKKNRIGKNKVVVPEKYYKVILDIYGDEVKAIAFIMPNEKSSQPLSSYSMSVDQAEKSTGLDFFPLIPDELEDKIESTANYQDW